MNKKLKKTGGLVVMIMALLMFSVPAITHAGFGVVEGNDQSVGATANFSLTAKQDFISVPDGGVIPMWGYSDNSGSGRMLYPGPTLIVGEGQIVNVTLTNEISQPTSIVFPGHVVKTSGGTHGLLTAEAATGGIDTVVYTFTATNPGTYTYYSGTSMDLQVEMGLMGVIIVRPAGFNQTDEFGAVTPGEGRSAYGNPESAYDVEFLELFDDIDPAIHDLAALGQVVDTNTNTPFYWFFNGRAFPDTLEFDLGNATGYVPWLPTQPYDALTIAAVGQKILVRVAAAGNDLTPQHFHGNNGKLIARDGRQLVVTVPAVPATNPPIITDTLYEDINTLVATPGQTADMIWKWTGQDLDWDFYGHSKNGAMNKHEVLASTTLATTINATATSLNIALTGWGPGPDDTEIIADDGVVPSTHTINAIIYDVGSTYPNQDANAELVKLRSTGSGAYAVERGTDGSTAKPWLAGSKIAYTEHGRPFPVILPELQDMSFGGVYSGSPFLGEADSLPPGQGGLNPFNAFAHPWHVHHEKNLVNNDLFIGGQLTVILITAPDEVSPPLAP